MEVATKLQEKNPERMIYENRQEYFKFESGDTSDITSEILSHSETLSLGEMDTTSDFTLFSTMSSLEIGHTKMDLHYDFQKSLTFKRAIKENKIKHFNDLNNIDLINLFDQILVKEMLWISGSTSMSMFTLIYFTSPELNNLNEDTVFSTLINSTKYLIFLGFNNLKDCTVFREEDYHAIPIHNIGNYNKKSVINGLKNLEAKLRNSLKDIHDPKEKKITSSLVLRLKFKRLLLKLLDDIFNLSNKNRIEEFRLELNNLKEVFEEYKKSNEFYDDNYKGYFSNNLIKLLPMISSIKRIPELDFKGAILVFEQLLNQFSQISKIFDYTDFFQIQRALEDFTSEKPFVISRAILELNLFPKGTKLLFDKTDFSSIIKELLKELKIDFLQEDSDLMVNYSNLCKEILLKNIKNKSKQVQESNSLFEALTYILIEGNKVEKKEKSRNALKKTVLTNLLLKQIFYEMFHYVFIQMKFDMFSYFELDYIFFVIDQIVTSLHKNNMMVASKFAEKILREENFIQSQSKKKLTSSQKMILDEIHIFNAIKNASSSMFLICVYLKKNNLLQNCQSDEFKSNEKLRINNRFAILRNLSFCIDISYEKFIDESSYDIKDNANLLQEADSLLKQAIKLLNEIKSTDIKLRDNFHYSNEFIDNLNKTIATNTIFLLKAKTLKKPSKIVLNYKKYNCFFPILEIV